MSEPGFDSVDLWLCMNHDDSQKVTVWARCLTVCSRPVDNTFFFKYTLMDSTLPRRPCNVPMAGNRLWMNSALDKVAEMYHKVTLQSDWNVSQRDWNVSKWFRCITKWLRWITKWLKCITKWLKCISCTGVDYALVLVLIPFLFFVCFCFSFSLFHWGAWIIWKFIYEFVAMWQNNDLVAIGKIMIC